MFLEEDKYFQMMQERIERLQGMIRDSQNQLIEKIRRANQETLENKKHKKFENILKQRIYASENFISAISDTHFKMLADQEYLMLTTETDVIQKVEKFKKNVYNSLHKITQNLDPDSDRKERGLPSEEKIEEDDDNEDDYSRKPGSSEKRKSKNYKISIDASMRMVDWLLVNFEKPYPTMAQKQEMARLGGISLTKVNNWFINARERTVKGYFNKDI